MALKVDLTTFSYDGSWFEHKGGRFKIRPYPQSLENSVFGRDGMVYKGQEALKKFMYCLEEWDRVTDANGNPLALTDQVKKIVFDSGMGGIAEFVLMTTIGLEKERVGEEKNSVGS